MSRRASIGIVLLLLGAWSCYRPTYGDCKVRCSPAVGCPEDLQCVAGFCTRGTVCGEPPADGPGADAHDGATTRDSAAPDAPGEPRGPAGDDARADAGDDARADAGDAGDAADAGDGGADADIPVVDAGTDAAGGDAGPAGCHVLGTPGIALWLDSTSDLSPDPSGRVSFWGDRSGAGNHAQQPFGSSMPKYTRGTARRPPAVTFDGVQTFLAVEDDVSLRWGVGDYAVLIVVRSINGSSDESPMVFQKTAANYPWAGPGLFLNPYGTWNGYLGVGVDADHTAYSPSGDYNDGLFHLMVARRSGGFIQIRVDGEIAGQVRQRSEVDVDAVGRVLVIGHNGYNSTPRFQALRGDIAEVVAIGGAHTESDLKALEACLMNKHGLPERPSDAPVVDPAAPADLRLWLDASSGVEVEPSFVWRDRSRAANDATAGAAAPSLAPPGDGRPSALHFSGAGDYLRLPAGMDDFSRGVTLFVVARPELPNGGAPSDSASSFIDFGVDDGDPAGFIAFSRLGLDGGQLAQLAYHVHTPGSVPDGVTANVAPPGELALFEVLAQGGTPGQAATFFCFENGHVVGQGTAPVPDVVERRSPLIGRSNRQPDGGVTFTDFRGAIGEIVLYDRALGDAERRGVERYLMNRWQLP